MTLLDQLRAEGDAIIRAPRAEVSDDHATESADMFRRRMVAEHYQRCGLRVACAEATSPSEIRAQMIGRAREMQRTGLSNRRIAQILGVSSDTVRKYLTVPK